MNELNGNLKYYALLIKKDYLSYIANKDIDGGNYFINDRDAHRLEDLKSRKNAVNGSDPESIWPNNKYKGVMEKNYDTLLQ